MHAIRLGIRFCLLIHAHDVQVIYRSYITVRQSSFAFRQFENKRCAHCAKTIAVNATPGKVRFHSFRRRSATINVKASGNITTFTK